MSGSRDRKTETLIYVAVWLVAVGLYLVHVIRGRSSEAVAMPLFDIPLLQRMARTLLPFVGLFVVNNCLLIPRLLLRNRMIGYLFGLALLMALVCMAQYADFLDWSSRDIHMPPVRDIHHCRPPLVAMPLFIDFLYDMLIVGCNIACALVFQRYEDKLAHESLLKADAENRLSYLKAQINPHFYMNMLNNIHGMIEINPEKAQDMVLDMSRLMRYMLYESSQPFIALASEICFLRDYLRIMRQRFPESKVRISVSFPSEDEVGGIRIPPLLYLVYIENAFKHGVSYREESYVAVKIAVDGDKVEFSCTNSVHPAQESQGEGIGLHNVQQRLMLIYGNGYDLTVHSGDTEYSVNLTVPVHED